MLSALELRGVTIQRPRGRKRVVVEGVERTQRKRNLAKMREYQKAWRKRNPEKFKASQRKYRASARGKLVAQRQKIRHYARHGERLRERAKVYWHTVRKFREQAARNARR